MEAGVARASRKPFKTELKVYLRRLLPDFARTSFAEHVTIGPEKQAPWSAIDTNSVKSCADRRGGAAASSPVLASWRHP